LAENPWITGKTGTSDAIGRDSIWDIRIGWRCPPVLNGDGHVGQGDLGILLADWGCGT